MHAFKYQQKDRRSYLFVVFSSMILHYENKINKCIWKYVNLLHCDCCQPAACFIHLLWPDAVRCVYEEYVIKTTKPMNKYKVLGFKYVIHNIQWNTKYR
jgi:hypothetical protein